MDASLASDLQGKDLFVAGVIASIPTEDDCKWRFEFDIESLRYHNEKVPSPSKIRLSWFKNRLHTSGQKSASHNLDKLKAGQRWKMWIRLKQPHGFMNPGGFDYEGWLYQKRIRATGYVRINSKVYQYAKKIDDNSNSYFMHTLRQTIYDNIQSLTQSAEHPGILTALALGERSGITSSQWQVFRATGTNHLVAISGLHIGLLAGFVFFLVQKFWCYCGTASLYLAAPRAAAIASFFIAALYAGLSGFAVPAQRALIMILVVMLAIYRLQKIQSYHILSIALLLVLLFDPNSVLAAGFWLSFIAVAIISLASLGRLGLDKNWWVWGRVQWRISLALIPLLIFLFQQASIISPITNLIAIPVVSILVVPIVLLASILASFFSELASFLFSLADYTVQGLWWVLAWFAEKPYSEIFSARPALLPLVLSSIGIFLLLTPKAFPIKFFGIFLLIPLLWPKHESLKDGEAEFTLLDVGQGLSVVVTTKKHALLFDAGPKLSDDFDTGAAVVVPFLRERQIKKLDMFIISHKDNDHRGGVSSVLKAIDTDMLLSSYGAQGSYPCYSGHLWEWDGVIFEILNPIKLLDYKKRNNASCVLRVFAGKDSILISADIEKQAENQLLKHHKQKLRSTYLVVPHHGSKTSSSQGFLNAVQPTTALFPVGYRNRYRMPHSSVIKRYQQMGIKMYATSSGGSLSFKIGQKSTSKIVKEHRKEKLKYWHSRH